MFKQLKNIETSFQHIRTFSICFLIGTILLIGFGLYKFCEIIDKKDQRIYILQGENVVHAEAADRASKIEVELRAHIKTFHRLFFTLDPDEKVIKENLTGAMYLADGTAQQEYRNLQENGYYSGIISGNISQRIQVDSIWLDTRVSPYHFRCYAKQLITRSTSQVTRLLITAGSLRKVSQSDNNPHGFLIERWNTIENRDLNTESR